MLLMLPLSSCVVANKNMVASLGGKGAYKGKDFGLVWDSESSFRDAATVAALGVGAWQSVAATKSADALSAIRVKEATKLGTVQSNNATAIELGAQAAGVEKAKILAP